MRAFDFFVLRDVHSPNASSGKFTGRFASKEKHSELVLIIFYLQLINCDHSDSSTADKSSVRFPLEDTDMLWMNITSHEKVTTPHRMNVFTWCILM